MLIVPLVSHIVEQILHSSKISSLENILRGQRHIIGSGCQNRSQKRIRSDQVP
jgi:hypothetical protein